MSSSLLLQQSPAYLVHLIWIVFVMGVRWPYSCCFVGCSFQDLFNIARSILVQLSSSLYNTKQQFDGEAPVLVFRKCEAHLH